jgi:hypothetical protein
MMGAARIARSARVTLGVGVMDGDAWSIFA